MDNTKELLQSLGQLPVMHVRNRSIFYFLLTSVGQLNEWILCLAKNKEAKKNRLAYKAKENTAGQGKNKNLK